MKRRQFVQQLGWGGVCMGASIFIPGCIQASDGIPPFSLYTPESQGVSSQGLIDFLLAAEESGLEFHSIMVNRNGKTIMEGWWHPFKKPYIHTLYSLSKSFTSSAIGLLYDEGKLSVEDKVISFFPDKRPETVSDNLAAMRVYDLLTMHTGHEQDTTKRIRAAVDGDWVRAFLHLDVPKEPGTHFLYNTGATYMLAAIVQKLSGEKLIDYLKPRLLDPLNIVGADWEECPKGINVGGYGLRVRTQDILNFGQLYLQKGEWNGQQLISKEWVEEATGKQVNSQKNDSDWGQGYGYQFWQCKPACYRGDGAFGQFCIVAPEKNAVIAITSESKDMGASMQLVWDHILPAMKGNGEILSEETAPIEKLRIKSEGLSLATAGTSAEANMVPIINGKTFTFKENELGAKKVSFFFREDDCEVTFLEDKLELKVKSGLQFWITADNHKEGNTLFAIPGRTPKPTKFSSYYYWKDYYTMVMMIKYVENVHHDIFTFTFPNNEMTLNFDTSLTLWNMKDERPTLTGIMT